MGPVGDIIIISLYIVDLVFSFDGAVFSETHIHTCPVLLVVITLEAGILEGLMGAVHTNTSGSGAFFIFFSFPISGLFKGAKTGRS